MYIMDNRKKILIVDDEPLYINILVDLLSDDYDTVVATNGKQALKRALDRPDLILLDILMPDMDGYEVCKRLKYDKRSCNAPVIFLTVQDELDDEVRGFEVGAVDYINKPMSPAIVKARIATHLKLSEVCRKLTEENLTLLTEQRKKEIEIRRKEKMAALGTLTSGIAHDFNNILGAILGYSELLQMHLKDNKKLARFSMQIQKAASRGSHITQKLLSYSRQESFQAESININTLLEEEKNILNSSLTSSIQLSLNLDKKIWPVYLDKSDLQDAILNISINAMHAMPTGGALTLRTHNLQLTLDHAHSLKIPAGDYVQLSLADTGTGMNQATKEKIFDPFFSTKGDKGTGLGMSQVYRFIEKSSGAIHIHSVLEQGTQITLYFPRHKNLTTTNKKHSGTKPADGYPGDETILIVDDEKALGDLFCEYLSGLGYRVLYAKDADTALGILQKNPINLLLSDVIMQGMDGYKLAEIVQQKYPAIKIQIISGFSGDQHLYSSNDDLFKKRLQKPVPLMSVAKRVRELLDQ